MSAGIYARKSTEQRGDQDTKSITRQVADARVFAARLGLPPIDDGRVYADDAVSGADVKNLQARARLIADVAAGRITTVVMADMSRFSRREGHEVVGELQRIARKATVYFYETGEKYVFGDIGSNIANFARAESNADYRRKVRTKTMAAMKRKAASGFVLGGRCFGYRNVDVATGQFDSSGRSIRSHVTREILETEAAVVREIFERYASGQGFKKIADALNRKGTPTPRPRPGRRKSWTISSVRSTLRNPLYRGIARWGRLKQHDEEGPQRTTVNPEDEHITFYDERWRIVPEALADAVDASFAEEGRKKFGPKPGAGTTKYLLSGGVLICPACGGRFEAMNGKYYVCGTRRKSGSSVCSNPLALRIDVFDDFVLGFLDGQVLHPAFIEQVLNLACGNRKDDGRDIVQAERDQLTETINRLIAVIEAGATDVAEVAAKLKARTAERATLDRRLASMAEPADRERLKAALEQRSTDWRARLRSEHPEEARHIVRQLIGSLTLWWGEAHMETFAPMEGFDPLDRSGKEGIDFSDFGFCAVVTPAGLLNGLGAFNMVAGGRNAHERTFRVPLPHHAVVRRRLSGWQRLARTRQRLYNQ